RKKKAGPSPERGARLVVEGSSGEPIDAAYGNVAGQVFSRATVIGVPFGSCVGTFTKLKVEIALSTMVVLAPPAEVEPKQASRLFSSETPGLSVTFARP